MESSLLPITIMEAIKMIDDAALTSAVCKNIVNYLLF